MMAEYNSSLFFNQFTQKTKIRLWIPLVEKSFLSKKLQCIIEISFEERDEIFK